MKYCSVPDCKEKYYAKDFCSKHYAAQPHRRAIQKNTLHKWKESHPERRKALSRKFSRTPRRRFGSAKRRAKNTKKLNWEITFEEFVLLIILPCYYCGGNIGETGSGLDRLDNRYGYVLGNIVPCCGQCNFTKGKLEGAGFKYPRTVELMRELVPITL